MIEERGHGRKTFVVNAVCLRAFGEGIIAIIYIKQISSAFLVKMSGRADVNVLKSVGIDICNSDTRRPMFFRYSRCSGNIFESESAFVQV
jgi:hypothetical protein